MTSGRTKLVTSRRRRPVRARASISATLTSVALSPRARSESRRADRLRGSAPWPAGRPPRAAIVGGHAPRERAITICWTSSVPSPMVRILASAVEAAHRILLDVPVAAVDLHSLLVARTASRPRLELGLGGGQGKRLTLIFEPGGPVGEQPGRLDLGGHVGELGRDHLELGDRTTERPALPGRRRAPWSRAPWRARRPSRPPDYGRCRAPEAGNCRNPAPRSPSRFLLGDVAVGEGEGRVSTRSSPILR